jgi:hypothetical protein
LEVALEPFFVDEVAADGDGKEHADDDYAEDENDGGDVQQALITLLTSNVAGREPTRNLRAGTRKAGRKTLRRWR